MAVTDTPRETFPSAVQHPVMAQPRVSASQGQKQLNMNHADGSSDSDHKRSVMPECHDVHSCYSDLNCTTAKAQLIGKSKNQLCPVCFKNILRNKPNEKQIDDIKCKLELELKHLPASDV